MIGIKNPLFPFLHISPDPCLRHNYSYVGSYVKEKRKRLACQAGDSLSQLRFQIVGFLDERKPYHFKVKLEEKNSLKVL